MQQVSFLLIHEILDAGDRLMDHGGLDGYVRSEFVSSCARLRLDGGDTVPLGLWCDGVVTKWDRSSSSPSISQAWAQSCPRCASPSSPSTSPSLLHDTRVTTSCPWWCGP